MVSLLFALADNITYPLIIKKGKKYVKVGQTPPKGVALHRGPHGGVYYLVEDRHLKISGKHHELVRSRGVTRAQWAETEKHYKNQGAHSVEFINMPDNEKNAQGKNLYNIYVHWDDTDKRLTKKEHDDKVRYGHPKVRPDQIESGELWKEENGVHIHPAYDKKNGRYVRNGQYEVHPSGQFGAKLFHVDKTGRRSKIALSYEPVYGETSETDINELKSRQKNVEKLKKEIRTLNPRLRSFLTSEMDRRDQERASNLPKAKKISKNPNFDLHKTLNEIRETRRPPIGVSGMNVKLPHDPSDKQAWVAKYNSFSPEDSETGILYGTNLIKHSYEDEDSRTFTFPGDGLYQAQGYGEVLRRHYRVKDGKVRQIKPEEWTEAAAMTLPVVSKEDLLNQIRDRYSQRKIKIAGNTYDHHDWIRSTLGGKWNASDRVWEIPRPSDESRHQALLQELKGRGISVIGWNHSPSNARVTA